MAASYIQLPTDTSNTGKKNRTQTRAVGSDTVHEHFVVPSPDYEIIGRFTHCSTVARAIVNTAVAITTDTVATYLQMSTASARVAYVRHISISYGSGDPVISKTAPLITATKFTFATAFSGTTQNIASLHPATTNPTANVNVSPAGATVTPVGVVGQTIIPAIFTTVAAYTGGDRVLFEQMDPNTLVGTIELESGQGIAIHQTANGTASDTRNYVVRLIWDEIDD